MGNTITFTSSLFSESKAFASGNVSATTILSADNTYDRRLYGLTMTNSATQTPTCTIKILDAASGSCAAFIVTLTTGINVMTDIHQNSVASGIFQHCKDAAGVSYFNVPKGYTITATLSANSTNSIYSYCYGETYN